jgi:hypothetical protein
VVERALAIVFVRAEPWPTTLVSSCVLFRFE